MRATAVVAVLGAVATSAYYWPILVDEPASIRNYQIAAAAPRLRPTAWALIQGAFKDQAKELSNADFGDPTDLQRATTVKYGYICREVFENGTVKNVFKLRSVEDSFGFDFSVRNAQVGTVHGEFKLAGENFRNGSASLRYHGHPRKSTATIYEVKDPLEPVSRQFEFALYSTKAEERVSALINTYGKLVG